jgi:hypothetical protein
MKYRSLVVTSPTLQPATPRPPGAPPADPTKTPGVNTLDSKGLGLMMCRSQVVTSAARRAATLRPPAATNQFQSEPYAYGLKP